MNKLSVVIPALNEEDSIESVMARVLSTRPDLNAVGFRILNSSLWTTDPRIGHRRWCEPPPGRA